MKLRSSELVIPADNPFSNDLLKREEHVNALADFVENIEEPLVIAVNSPWGTGKTTFLRLLEAVLESRQITSLHFNAWTNDFSDDAFIALVSELGGFLESGKGKAQTEAAKHLTQARHIGAAIVKRSIPALLKMATSGVLDLSKVSEEALASLVESAAADAIKKHDEGKRTIEAFRTSLEKYVAALRASRAGEDKTQPPLVFFVDELDRCRPPYAIALLEKIKHLFNVDGLVFVLAIDSVQLGHSLRSVYGRGMNVDGYLRRLIDFDYQLPVTEKGALLQARSRLHSKPPTLRRERYPMRM